MYYKLKLIFFTGVVACAVIACSQALYIPTLADSQKTGVSTDTLVFGRKLYVNKCAGCHTLYLPEQYTIKEWDKIMPSMQTKAKCSNEEIEIINKYLLARSKPE